MSDDEITVELKLSPSERRTVQRRAEEIRRETVESLQQWRGDEEAELGVDEMNEAEYIKYLVKRDLRESGHLGN